jgi:hypothetical protein
MDKLKEFESKYEVRIEDSKEYRQYVKQMPYYMWDGKAPMDLEVQVVPMKAVHLTSHNLERLVRDYEHMERRLERAEYDKRIVDMVRADERVRDANPVVQKAYEKYLTLLELVRK